jgi:hypothetical protein
MEMEKGLNFWEMSNINAMEDLSVLTPSAWAELDAGDCDDCRDPDADDCR